MWGNFRNRKKPEWSCSATALAGAGTKKSTVAACCGEKDNSLEKIMLKTKQDNVKN